MANRALDWVGMPKQGGKGPLEQEKEREEVLNYKDSTLSWRWGTAKFGGLKSPLLPGFWDCKRSKKQEEEEEGFEVENRNM